MKSFVSPFLFAAALALSHGQLPPSPTALPAARPAKGASPRDGFSRRGGELVMTRDGVTARVDREVVFPNGLRVREDGKFVLPDGRTETLRSNQLLTFDGVVENVALTPDGTAP